MVVAAGEVGELAQLGERLLCTQEVTGSSPVFSTKFEVEAEPFWKLSKRLSFQLELARRCLGEGGPLENMIFEN